MASAKERIQKTVKKTYSIEEKMEEIRIVNKAKWLLISEIKMDEPEAHHYIEKQAMDRCISKRTVAEEIIKTYSWKHISDSVFLTAMSNSVPLTEIPNGIFLVGRPCPLRPLS